jgi:8-amino-7-oxononanoate synthase
MRLEPIAIAGIGCRFPGANNPQAFWQLLRDGVDSITEVPASRWNVEEYYDRDPTKLGKTNTRYGGFLDNIDRFDPQFFGISPREAVTIDPQQRLLLEVAWEALADAGQVPEQLAGTQTGVFIGIGTHDYSILLWQDPVSEPYATTGTGNCIAANRISYVFDFKGPSLAIDTACSSSLVAVHLACQSLWQGECSMALAGGVNLLLLPTLMVGFSKGGFMADDGRCKSFDAKANGYVRGEGAGIVVLKPLAQAQADGDRIYAVIRGSAVNQDGFSNGMAAPNPQAQAAVLREAYKKAGCNPSQIQYVEAHGTGTKLGDFVEAQALGEVLAENRTIDNYCAIGSVKTNIGHSETAAGIASLIKVALAMKHRQIPPSLHFHTPNPDIDFDKYLLRVQTKLAPWETNGELPLAGINSFGFGGTNAHVVVEAAPQTITSKQLQRPLQLLTISAKSDKALQELAQSYQTLLEDPLVNISDVCFTANTARSHFNHRLAIVADSQSMSDFLAAYIRKNEISGVVSNQVTGKTPPKIAFLFTGQGSQYVNMGKQLYETEPLFRANIERCDAILRNYLDIPLEKLLNSDALNETAYTQPALFALEYSLAKLWMSWGIMPSVVMGHSVGEYVAACIAGVFSLEDGLKLIAHRGRLMQELPPGGVMFAVMATEDRVRDAIASYQNEVAIAAINGSQSITISGKSEAIDKVLAALEGIKATKLNVSHAFHSPLMQPMLAQFAQIAGEVTYHSPQIDLVSNVTGKNITEEIANPEYWCKHISQTVRFSESMSCLYEQGYRVFLEIGAKPILLGMGRNCLPQEENLWLPSLRLQVENEQILQSLAELYVRGIKVNWTNFEQNSGIIAALPTYPFQRQRYWWEGAKLKSQPTVTNHPLLGQKLSPTNFESVISQDSPDYLKDHCFNNQPIFPATAYLEMALAAGFEVFKSEKLVIENFSISKPLVLTETPVRVQLILTPEDSGYAWQILSFNSKNDSWLQHAQGKIALENFTTDAILQAKCERPISVTDYYQQVKEQGLEYGESFQAITELWVGKEEALGKIELPKASENYQFHPILLDASLQVLGAILLDKDIYLPVGCDRIQVYRRPNNCLWSHVQLKSIGQQIKADLQLFDENKALVAEIHGLTLRYANRPKPVKADLSSWLYEVDWQAKPKSLQSRKAENWLIFADSQGIGESLAGSLREKGDRIVLVFPSQTYEKVHQSYHINPANPQDFQQLIEEIKQPLDKVVHLWSTENTQEMGCGSVLHLVQALTQTTKSPQLWLITEATQAVDKQTPLQIQHSTLWGLGRVIRLEHPDLHCVNLDLDTFATSDLFTELNSPADAENQIAYRRGIRYVARLIQRNSQSATATQLKISSYGMLDNLTLVPIQRQAPKQGEVEIQVCAAGVNFRDVLNALGMLQEYLEQMGFASAADVPLGGECAGKIVGVGDGVTGLKIGDEVIAAQALGSLSSFVTVNSQFVVIKPKQLSFTEAATVATTFLTASYGLHYLAKIKPGDRILIHAAAGGVGLAAVQIAQKAGAEVFATASPAKWNFLKSIGVNNVFNSRTLDFSQEVTGIDIVFNSLNGEFIPKSLGVLAPGGIFVEIGKLGIWDDSQVKQTRGDVSYYAFDLLDLSAQNPDLIATMLEELMQKFQQGILQPLPHKVFPISDAAIAFRYMAQAKHIGKVVISLPEANNQLTIRDDCSYLITGGLGDLGLEAAKWLVNQGAKHLVLTGRNVERDISQLTGAKVYLVQADVSKLEDVERVLSGDFPPVRGVIHAAGVLDDGVLQKLSWQRFSEVMKPKVAGAWNLHLATKEMPLDFFVCFSSITSLLGSPGQGNYAAANAYMDALVHYRHQLVLPGLSVNWGAWGNVGMVAQLAERDRQKITAQGMGSINPEQGLQLLQELLAQKAIQVGVLPVDWAKFPYSSPFLEAVIPTTTKSSSSSEFVQKLEIANKCDRQTILFDFVRSQIAKVLGFNSPELIEANENFADLGMDSLMAVELKNRLQATLGKSIAQSLVFDYPTLQALVEHLLGEVLLLDAPPEKPTTEPNKQVNQTPPLAEVVILPETETNEQVTQTLAEVEIPAQFYQFALSPEYLSIRHDIEAGQKIGNPFFKAHEGIAKDITQIEGRKLINYASYNYLGLSGEKQVSQAANKAIKRYGTSVSASRIVSGEIPLHRELEREIADFLGTEDCIVYIGGHTTNVTTISHLFGKNDLILYDALSHNSIRQGCALSDATAIEFLHNDWQALDRILLSCRHQYEKVLITVEGIYSTDGDIAPLPQLIEVKKRHKAFILVDEAHSIGVLGASGRGIGEYFQVSRTDVDLWMGTLSKSFASCGGYIAASKELVEYLKYTAPGFVFSVGMSPPSTAAALAALQLLKTEPKRVTKLHKKAKLFLQLAQKRGFDTGNSNNSPIIPIIVGESDRAVQLSQLLFKRGINALPMIYPSVAYNAARLRFFISCTHTRKQIDFTLDELSEATSLVF